MSRFKAVIYTLDGLLSASFPDRETLLLYEDGTPIVKQGDMIEVFAKRGCGKSMFAMGLSLALAAGVSWMCWRAPRPRKVLYIDGEMHADLIRKRGRQMARRMGVGRAAREGLAILARTWQKVPLPKLDSREGMLAVAPFLDADWGPQDEMHLADMERGSPLRRWGGSVVVLDNAVSLFDPEGEKDVSVWAKAQGWLLSLRDRGVTTILVHHAGAAEGKARGHTSREDAMDTIISLSHPRGYKQEQGLRINVSFDVNKGGKARDFWGDAAKDNLVWFDEEGWHHKPVGTRAPRPLEDDTMVSRVLGVLMDSPGIIPTHLANKVTGSRAAIFQAIEELIEVGQVIKEVGRLRVAEPRDRKK